MLAFLNPATNLVTASLLCWAVLGQSYSPYKSLAFTCIGILAALFFIDTLFISTGRQLEEVLQIRLVLDHIYTLFLTTFYLSWRSQLRALSFYQHTSHHIY